MILESGDLSEADGDLLTRKAGDGWTFLQAGDGLPKLTIRLGGHAKRADATYSLAELSLDPGFDGRGVKLEKISGGTDPNDREHSVIIPTAQDQHSYCTCRGFQRFARCKHTAAIRAIVARGLLQPEGTT